MVHTLSFTDKDKITQNQQLVLACCIKCCDSDVVIVCMPKSPLQPQKQADTDDCGLFALAFTTSLTYGHNPSTIKD